MQPKKSPRKPFSCMPTKPVAGEALSLHLSQPTHEGKQGNELFQAPANILAVCDPGESNRRGMRALPSLRLSALNYSNV